MGKFILFNDYNIHKIVVLENIFENITNSFDIGIKFHIDIIIILVTKIKIIENHSNIDILEELNLIVKYIWNVLIIIIDWINLIIENCNFLEFLKEILIILFILYINHYQIIVIFVMKYIVFDYLD